MTTSSMSFDEIFKYLRGKTLKIYNTSRPEKSITGAITCVAKTVIGQDIMVFVVNYKNCDTGKRERVYIKLPNLMALMFDGYYTELVTESIKSTVDGRKIYTGKRQQNIVTLT